MGRKLKSNIYKIYKITSPSGKSYIGYTGDKLTKRWYAHKRKAIKEPDYNHPFYNAIRKYGPDSFTVETIYECTTLEEAFSLEIKAISEHENLYNISSGGSTDAEIGGKIFWEDINSNPKKRKKYLKKLSKVKLDRDWSDYLALSKAALES
jgi:predicted GIY-YIG superfamily endonuclease